ncbi:MAG: redoxin domain-containing protein [Burkholderiales bacterium]|nr:redoxin domain-containing protein [Burkholderiales bacterium]
MNVEILQLSIDPLPSLKGWADFLGGVPFPLLSDFWPHGAVGKAFGIFNDERGIDKRAAYVIDAQGVIRYAKVYPQGTIPTSEELLAEIRKL